MLTCQVSRGSEHRTASAYLASYCCLRVSKSLAWAFLILHISLSLSSFSFSLSILLIFSRWTLSSNSLLFTSWRVQKLTIIQFSYRKTARIAYVPISQRDPSPVPPKHWFSPDLPSPAVWISPDRWCPIPPGAAGHSSLAEFSVLVPHDSAETQDLPHPDTKHWNINHKQYKRPSKHSWRVLTQSVIVVESELFCLLL